MVPRNHSGLTRKNWLATRLHTVLEIDFISVFQFLIVFVTNARVHNCYFSIKAAQHFKLHTPNS